MTINIRLDGDEIRNAHIYLNAIQTHIGLTDVIEKIRQYLKYGSNNRTPEELLEEIKSDLEDLVILDLRDDNII